MPRPLSPKPSPARIPKSALVKPVAPKVPSAKPKPLSPKLAGNRYVPQRLPGAATVTSGPDYAERLVQSVLARRRRVAEQFYAMGVELRELAKPGCYLVLGYRSFGELLEGRKIINRMTALRLISVVDAFPHEVATELGLEKAYALVRYAEATPAPDVARELAAHDALVAGTRISAASVRDIVAETKRIRDGGRLRDSRDPAAKQARAAARLLQKALRGAGAGAAEARAVWEHGEWRVRVEMEADGALVVTGRLRKT